MVMLLQMSLTPYRNREMHEYIRKKRGGTLPLWSIAIVTTASINKGRKVDNSNSSSEGIIRWLKEDRDFQRHCISLALYIIYWYQKNVATDALFATQVQGLEASVETSNERKAKKLGLVGTMSEDMKMLEEENTEDVLWSKKGWDVGKLKLKSCIDRACGHDVVDRQFFCPEVLCRK